SRLQAAGKKVLVSAYGGGSTPTTSGHDPLADAGLLAAFVQKNGLDGADVDWEDEAAWGKGGEQWLISFTRELRRLLPRPRYLISHAPQGPHFSPGQYSGGAYLTVNAEVGDLIDFYNVQFYNQGGSSYDDCECLLFKAKGWALQSSVFEISSGAGVPLDKVVIGKPVTQAGVDPGMTGFMDPVALAACFRQAIAKGWNAGAM
ncbi:glycoside hydrolase superfamily, partial [Chytriomyces sp. MP71]